MNDFGRAAHRSRSASRAQADGRARIASHEVGAAFPADRRDSSFLKDVKTLIALRKREPALRRGNFDEVFWRDSVYVFQRTLGDDRILVALNGSDQAKTFAMPIGNHAWRSIQLEDFGFEFRASGWRVFAGPPAIESNA